MYLVPSSLVHQIYRYHAFPKMVFATSSAPVSALGPLSQFGPTGSTAATYYSLPGLTGSEPNYKYGSTASNYYSYSYSIGAYSASVIVQALALLKLKVRIPFAPAAGQTLLFNYI